MLRSLSSGVAGLKTHQTKMDVIGNNIANVNTYGFKSSRVTFKDVYYQTITGSSNASGNMGGSNASQVGYGSSVGTIDVMNSRAGFEATGSSMDCYIDGEGYFVIKDGSGNERLSQVGTLSFDGEGNLVDGQTNFVCGYPVESTSGKASVGNATIDFGSDNGKILNGYTVVVNYDQASTGTTLVTADRDKKTITVSAPINTDLTKTTLADALKDPTSWSWTKDTDGTTALTPTGLTNEDPTVDGSATDTTTKIAATSGMVAQVAKFDYTKAPEKIVNTYGALTNCTIGTDGTISGQDSTGTIQVIGQLALANVPNPQALTLEGNSYYKAVNNTGTITYSNPGSGTVGALKTGGLEMSNVDLATEFADMITTQRGFQANSKIITVSDDMLDTLISMKR